MNRLNPFYRLVFFILLMSSAILSETVPSFLLTVFSVSLVALSSGVRIKDLIQPVFKLRYFLLFVFLLNALFSDEGTLFSLLFIRVSKDGIIRAFLIVYRVSIVTLIAYLYTSCSDISEINDSLYILLSPLKLIFIPVDTLSSSLSIALSMIDGLMYESERLKKVRKLRRLGLPESLKEKILDYKAIVIPIFLIAFKRADELSFALESRGYSTKMKVKWEYLKIGKWELFSLLSVLVLLIIIVRGGTI